MSTQGMRDPVEIDFRLLFMGADPSHRMTTIVIIPSLLSPQRRVSTDINPIGSFRRHMTG